MRYTAEIESAFDAFDEISAEMRLVAEIGTEGVTDEHVLYECMVRLRQHAARIMETARGVALVATNPAP